jgi:beta-lactamase class D
MTRDRVAAPDFGKNRTKICQSRLEQSGYNKGTIRSDVRYRKVSKDVRRHRLISSDYIKILPVTAEVASSSLVVPAITFNHLQALIPTDQGILGDDKRKTRTPNCEFAAWRHLLDQVRLFVWAASRQARRHRPTCRVPDAWSLTSPAGTCS